MSRKIEVNRLDREELIYELTWRGIAIGTVEEMRSRLVLARQMERDGESLHYPPYPFTFQQDMSVLTKKLDDLVAVIDIFLDTSKSGSYLKLQTKLNHILGRLDNMSCTTADEFSLRGVIVAQVLTLIDQLHTKAAQAEGRTRVIPPNIGVLQGSLQQPPVNLAPLSHSSFMPSVHTPVNASTPSLYTPGSSSAIKPILPHKWNLKFSSDKKGMSVTAFFERVEELRRARNVTKDILLDSGIDLFEGRAYEFYQDCRTEVQSWDELVSKFKEEYQPAFYSERLLEEIKSRTQGPDESIGTYMAVMSRYFQRLQFPISEEARLTLLLRNISPVYRTQLGALEINSIAQLKSLCKRIEQRTLSVQYTPPPRKGHSLEPDLAYVRLEEELDEIRLTEPETQDRLHRPGTSGRKEIVCFNCNKPGHKAIGCVEKKKLFCFGCKKEGFTKRTCPNCNSGNGRRPS